MEARLRSHTAGLMSTDGREWGERGGEAAAYSFQVFY